MIDYSKFKRVAFKFDPELMHDLAFECFHYFPKMMNAVFPGIDGDQFNDSRYQLESHHLKWKFPVGAAAGLDKSAHALSYLSLLGFGSIEIGTVTPKKQEGNEKPRVFRYVKEEGLRNSMGFPNPGVDPILRKVKDFKQDKKSEKASVGTNIGANKENVLSDLFFEDLRNLYQSFSLESDYLVINISSPNTQNLRKYQSKDYISQILKSLGDLRKERPVPLFIKIAPDMTEDEVRDVVEVVKDFSINGVVATNTTIDPSRGEGGISGRPLYKKSKAVRAQILEMIRETPDIDLIGVGGFFDFNEMLNFWSLGGKFIQIYTSFIYKGPSLLNEIREGIDGLLERSGAQSFQELINSNPKDLKM